MNGRREVRNQAEFDAAIAAGDRCVVLEGDIRLETSGTARPIIEVLGKAILRLIARESSQPHVVAWGSSQPHVVAWGSSQPHVEARGSSQPHVVAWGSSQPHVVAWGSSQPHVEAWGSSQPHVEARGSSQPHVVAWGSSQPHVVAWGSSQPHVEARGSSQPHVEAWGSSQPHVVARESSQPHVEAWESSQPHVEAWGSSQPHVVARESSQPHVEAWESSQPHVVAWGSSQPHVVAWGSSQPHVVARESSQPHVEAWGSSQPHVVARGICQLAIRGAVKVIAAATVAIVILGGNPTIEGGGFIQRRDISTPRAWCDYYGLPVVAGGVVLFKSVGQNYRTNQRNFLYQPGTAPVADDWDGGKRECGGGLHFSPSTGHSLEFFQGPSPKFVACPVLLVDLAVHPEGEMPQKCKGRGLAAPCWEVDRQGKPVTGAVVTWPPQVQAAPAEGPATKAKRRPKAQVKRPRKGSRS